MDEVRVRDEFEIPVLVLSEEPGYESAIAHETRWLGIGYEMLKEQGRTLPDDLEKTYVPVGRVSSRIENASWEEPLSPEERQIRAFTIWFHGHARWYLNNHPDMAFRLRTNLHRMHMSQSERRRFPKLNPNIR